MTYRFSKALLSGLLLVVQLPLCAASDVSYDVWSQADISPQYRQPIVVPEALTAAEYLKLAEDYAQVEWPEQALQCVNKVEALQPDSDLARKASILAKTKLPRVIPSKEAVELNLLVLHACYKDPENAFALSDRCIKEFPQFEYSHLTRAYLESRAKNTNEAAAYYRKVLAINPDNTKALLGLGDILRDHRQWWRFSGAG